MGFVFAILIFIVFLIINKHTDNKFNQEEQQEIPGEIKILENNCSENNNLIHNLEQTDNINTNLISCNSSIVLNKINDTNIPNNIEELTNNHYEVLKRLNGSNIKYALTGIINVYHSNLSELLKKFKEFDLLRYSNLKEATEKMTIKELKEYLRNKNLKLTGNKKDLIERLLPELSEEEQKTITINNKCYILTEKGNQLLEKYKNAQENEQQRLFEQIIKLFKEKQISEAYKQICQYNFKYNNISGINFNWQEELEKGINDIDYKIIKWFMEKELSISEEILEEDFKAIICYTYLSGKSYNDIIKLIKNVYNYNEDILNIQYYNSMISNEREALVLENLDMEYYEILDTDNSCNKCKSKTHKKFKLSERKVGVNFPPLCKECKCTVVGYFD